MCDIDVENDRNKRQKTSDSNVKTYTCDSCDYTSLEKGRMTRHVKTHDDNKLFHCSFEGCNYSCNRTDGMTRHVQTHSDIQPFKCDFNECNYSCKRKDVLIRHQRIHNEEKKYQCDECFVKFAHLSTMKIHKRIHSGQKKYKCDECSTTFAHLNTLTGHKKTHGTSFHCNYENCNFKCSTSNKLITHEKSHTKPYDCKQCDFKGKDSYDISRHMFTHTGLRPYSCNMCTYKSYRSDALSEHMKTHTVEGQIRRKKQENRVYKLLKEWGYSVDCETTIKAKSSNCLVDTNRYFSRIDFHVVNCTNMILLIECDEDQHAWYNLSCEFSRMSDIRASLVKAGYTLPIYWIRYNPNGKYHIGEDQVKIYRPERESKLKKHIEMVCSNNFKPENQVNIHYMFYDLNSEIDGPSIRFDPDFPSVMNDVVSWTH